MIQNGTTQAFLNFSFKGLSLLESGQFSQVSAAISHVMAFS